MSEGFTYRTAEAVGAGHPDKVADQISDAVVDMALENNPNARVAVETLVTRNLVVIAGEMRDSGLDVDDIGVAARTVMMRLGYEEPGFDWRHTPITVNVVEQSKTIAAAVDKGDGSHEGAGDQGIVYGFACDESPELLPAPFAYAQRLVKRLNQVALEHEGLGQDCKAQVTMKYGVDGYPSQITDVVLSQVHHIMISPEQLRRIIEPEVASLLPGTPRLYINHSGPWHLGGPAADTGVTGRKLAVDSYGGLALHGGGAFSGKDPSKMDRTGAYLARHIAKEAVRTGMAHRCLVSFAYAIGKPDPLVFEVDAFGTGDELEILLKTYRSGIPFEPAQVRKYFDLNRPIYLPTATYGHFGRSPGETMVPGAFPWEHRLSFLG